MGLSWGLARTPGMRPDQNQTGDPSLYGMTLNLLPPRAKIFNLLNEPVMLSTFHLYGTVEKEHVFIPKLILLS